MSDSLKYCKNVTSEISKIKICVTCLKYFNSLKLQIRCQNQCPEVFRRLENMMTGREASFCCQVVKPQ